LILFFISSVGIFQITSTSYAGEFFSSWSERRKARREKLKQFLTKKQDSSDIQDVKSRGGFHVGYMISKMSAPNSKGDMVDVDIAVWYPSDDEGKPFQYTFGTNKVSTEIAVNGKPASGSFPLIIYSHGATGCGLSMAFLTERLASEGFIVAAPDYTDEFYGARIRATVPKQTFMKKIKMLSWMKELKEYQLNKGGKVYRHEFLAYRLKQTRLTIDKLINENHDRDSALHNSINENAIGMMGHSFGAWTAILVGGADTIYHDKRVKAIVPFSGPVNKSVYELDEIGNIQIPVMFMFGGEEPKVGRMSDREILYDRAHSPKFLLEIKGADHFTFSGGIRKEFPTIYDYVLRDSRRATIMEYTVGFFNYYLKNDKSAEEILRIKSGALVSYEKEF
jgi:predicted dienelactone hydrolase